MESFYLITMVWIPIKLIEYKKIDFVGVTKLQVTP